jgi:hypothetical protein
LATSYFNDALEIQTLIPWLTHFHEASLSLHSSTHPPGPILFYYLFIKVFGSAKAPFVAGCAVGLAGSTGVLVIYQFAKLWTEDQFARMHASALYDLLPALTLFFPEFDQIYPIFSMLLMLCWVKALSPHLASRNMALWAGIVLFAVTFFAYNLLAAGAFAVYYAFYWLWREGWARRAWITVLQTSGIAAGAFATLYIVLGVSVGYNPMASFLHAIENQAKLAQTVNRPYAIFVGFDLYDFALGGGVMAAAILLFQLWRRRHDRPAEHRELALTIIGLASILTVDFSGLLRGETARVWLFLQPLIVVPVAIELSRLAWTWRIAVFAVQWWILVCLKAKMSFVDP